MKNVLILAIAAALMCSCSTVTYKTRTARTADVPSNFVSQYNAAELAVSDTKASGTSDGCVTGRAKKLALVPNLKKNLENYAIADALQKSNADVLVGPQFTYHYKKSALVSVSVTGYPAVYRNFRTISYEEIVKARIEEKAAAGRQSPQIVIYGNNETK